MVFDFTSVLSILSLVISICVAINLSVTDSSNMKWPDKLSIAIVKKLSKPHQELTTSRELTEKIEIDLGIKVVSTDLEKIDQQAT